MDINTFGIYTYIPDDDYYSSQWHLAKIKANSAWDYIWGDNSIVIAILDSGSEWDHEDIGLGSDSYQNIYLNPSEDDWTDPNDPSTGNGIDDDSNGFIDDWIGWDFVNSNNNSQGVNRHGTLVAGIASAKTNNDIGVAGIAGGNNGEGVQLMIIGVGDYAPSSSILDDAINYAVDNGAHIIQMSLSVSMTSAIEDAIEDAYDNNDVVLVCAAGNDPSPPAVVESVGYPATNEHVIAVGATTSSDSKAGFSYYGTEMEIAAPGVGIYSTVLNDLYDDDDGTSFAAPQVSAAAGLLLSVSPGISNDSIRSILRSSADKVGGYNYNWSTSYTGHSKELGYGRLNIEEAIEDIFPEITNHKVICSSNKTFTLSNIPSGSTISWSKSSNLTPVDSTSTTYTVRAANIYTKNGEGWVQASIDAGNTNPIVVRQNLFVGVPKDASGHRTEYDGVWEDEYCPYDFFGFELIQDNPAYAVTNYDWIINGSSSTSLSPCKDVYTQGEGYEVLYVEIENTCGHSGEYDYGYMVTSSACEQGEGGEFDYKMFPNPAESFITIDLTDSKDIEPDILINIADQQSRIVKTLSIKSNYITIPISDLLPGMYYVEVKLNMQSRTKTLIIGKK